MSKHPIIKKSFLNDLGPEELNKKLGEAWLNAFIDERTIFNPLAKIPDSCVDNPELYYTWLMSQPDYFYFLIKEIFGMDSFPMQCLILKELYNHKFPILIGSRGLAKTSTIAMYCIIRMMTIPGRKIIITSGGFRQAKMVFNYMEDIWNKSPLLQSCYNTSGEGITHANDAWSFRLGDSITYALPTGPDGSKLRGYRANDLVAEEFSSMKKDIFETVMSGFLSVTASPVMEMRRLAKNKVMRSLNIPVASTEDEESGVGNQLILCGTAYYTFNHFFDYFVKWREIILSQGDPAKLEKAIGEMSIEDSKYMNWKDYSIIRIPVELTKEGFMDMSQINRVRASSSDDVYCREYGACFSSDSNGFFKRSLIESATPSHNNLIFRGAEQVECKAMMKGRNNFDYIMGVDPAYQGDNFAIVILEADPNGTLKIAHVWTTQSSDHKQRLKDGVISEHNYYYFCARKIMELRQKFPCDVIGIDSQGGGKAILEALSDVAKGDELPLFEIIDPKKPKDTDFQQGHHIVHMINFTSKWIHDINHDVKKRLEQKTLLFPSIDAVDYVEAEYYDSNSNNSLYDTLEDCITEIEELKKEMCSIIVTATPGGTTKFTTPSEGQKKDRYSALLISAFVYTENENLPIPVTADMLHNKRNRSSTLYQGDSEICKKFEELYRSRINNR